MSGYWLSAVQVTKRYPFLGRFSVFITQSKARNLVHLPRRFAILNRPCWACAANIHTTNVVAQAYHTLPSFYPSSCAAPPGPASLAAHGCTSAHLHRYIHTHAHTDIPLPLDDSLLSAPLSSVSKVQSVTGQGHRFFPASTFQSSYLKLRPFD